MKILALESSAVSASVALTEDEKLVAQSLSELRPDTLTHAAADGGKPAGKLRRIAR